MTEAGQIVLVVPGVIPDGALELAVRTAGVTLAVDSDIFVQVGDIDDHILDTLAGQDHVDLIAVPDDDHPPEGITHQAGVKDYR